MKKCRASMISRVGAILTIFVLCFAASQIVPRVFQHAGIIMQDAAVAAGKPAGGGKVADLPVTSTISDSDPSGIAYLVQSDGLGAYKDGLAGVESILQGVSQNGLSGDWILNSYNTGATASAGRNALITLSAANEVMPGDPNFTAPANPPFTGTSLEPFRFIAKCSSSPYFISVKAIKPGSPAYCPLLLRFAAAFGRHDSDYYRLDMGHSYQYPPEPETQDVQISCNAVDGSGNCKDWSVDSIPPLSQSGGILVNRVRARLNLNPVSTPTNEGDFYLTFHIRVTNP